MEQRFGNTREAWTWWLAYSRNHVPTTRYVGVCPIAVGGTNCVEVWWLAGWEGGGQGRRGGESGPLVGQRGSRAGQRQVGGRRIPSQHDARVETNMASPLSNLSCGSCDVVIVVVIERVFFCGRASELTALFRW